jgi:hypothetical protein
MNRFIIRTALVATLFFCAVISQAQETSGVETAVKEIVKKYDGKDKVNCMSIVKGGGLELVKMALNKEFGKSFMKGVTSITIIDYSDASEATCAALRKELEVFSSLLQEFNLNEEKQFSDNDYIKCFASENSGVLSDFVVALESEKSKTVMYMAGKIIIEE